MHSFNKELIFWELDHLYFNFKTDCHCICRSYCNFRILYLLNSDTQIILFDIGIWRRLYGERMNDASWGLCSFAFYDPHLPSNMNMMLPSEFTNWQKCTQTHTGHIQNKFLRLDTGNIKLNQNIFSDTSLVGGDTLTCGECKKDFKLQELTLFIQHKALNSCKKIVKQPKSVDTDFEDVRMLLMISLLFYILFSTLQVKSSSPKDGNYVSLGSPSISGSGRTYFKGNIVWY